MKYYQNQNVQITYVFEIITRVIFYGAFFNSKTSLYFKIVSKLIAFFWAMFCLMITSKGDYKQPYDH